jgi:hypothetical protein
LPCSSGRGPKHCASRTTARLAPWPYSQAQTEGIKQRSKRIQARVSIFGERAVQRFARQASSGRESGHAAKGFRHRAERDGNSAWVSVLEHGLDVSSDVTFVS